MNSSRSSEKFERICVALHSLGDLKSGSSEISLNKKISSKSPLNMIKVSKSSPEACNIKNSKNKMKSSQLSLDPIKSLKSSKPLCGVSCKQDSGSSSRSRTTSSNGSTDQKTKAFKAFKLSSAYITSSILSSVKSTEMRPSSNSDLCVHPLPEDSAIAQAIDTTLTSSKSLRNTSIESENLHKGMDDQDLYKHINCLGYPECPRISDISEYSAYIRKQYLFIFEQKILIT